MSRRTLAAAAIAAIAIVAIIVGWRRATRTVAPRALVASVAGDDGGARSPTPEARAPSRPRLAGDAPEGTADEPGEPDEPNAPRGAFDNGPAWSALPAGYPSKAFDVDSVHVNLRGEPVTVTQPYGRAGDPPPVAELRGRVREAGAPAAGVTVVVAARFHVMWGHLGAQAATVTGADGRFVVRVPDSARWALALGPRGWSALSPVVRGRELELELVPAAGLTVEVLEDGAPLHANLAFATADHEWSGAVTAKDGVFRFAALPPGPLLLRASAAHEFATGQDEVAPVEVILRAGQVVRQQIHLDSKGATVVVHPVLPEGTTATMVSFGLLAPPAPTDMATLRALRLPLLGGRDAANDYQFHRIPPGPRVACVIARLEAEERWGCKEVIVPVGGVVEVAVPAAALAETGGVIPSVP